MHAVSDTWLYTGRVTTHATRVILGTRTNQPCIGSFLLHTTFLSSTEAYCSHMDKTYLLKYLL